MTATYDPNVGDNVSKIRLMVSDTDVGNAVFTDEEIGYFLTTNANDLNLTAADVFEAWVAKYATAPDSEKIGDYAYTQKIVAHLNKLATEHREKAANIPYMAWSEFDLTGITDTTVEEDIE